MILKKLHREWLVRVLWIKGLTIEEIASAVDLTPGQVKGRVHRTYGDRPRSAMTLAERTAELEGLRALMPTDMELPKGFGFLPRKAVMKEMGPAGGRQVVLEQVEAPDGKSKIEVFRAVPDGLEEARLRGWLYEAKTDGASHGIAGVRLSVGQRLMKDFRQAQLSGVGSPSFEQKVSGTPNSDIRATTMEATRLLLKMQGDIHMPCWPILEAVCGLGENLGEIARQKKKPAKTLRRLFRRALDDAAVFYGDMDKSEYQRRWGYRTYRRVAQQQEARRLPRIKAKRMLKRAIEGAGA